MDRETLLSVMGERGGIMRAAEMRALGANPGLIEHLHGMGELESPLRGVYALADRLYDHRISLAFIFARQPNLVLCLTSAAAFHGLIDREPEDVFLAAGRDIRVSMKPKPLPRRRQVGDGQTLMDFPVKVVRWPPLLAASAGIEEIDHYGVSLRLTNPERTVCDMLRCLKKPFRGPKQDDGSHPSLYIVEEAYALQALETLVERNGGIREIEDMALEIGCQPQIDTYLKLASRRPGYF